MAKEVKEPVTEQPVESLYDADELAQNAPALFGYSIDMARAALRVNGVEQTTVAKAKQIIKTFAERKVD